jgi:8-oxo-dGDP phosphatase
MPEPVFTDESFEVPITRRSTEFTGHVWNIVSETFTYNGIPTTREFVEHPGAVSILALDESNRILTIQQYRHPIRSRDWEVPAGLLDEPDESPLAAAKRELAEEADLVAGSWNLLAEITTSPGGSDEFLRIYLARDLSPTKTPHPREAEEADIVKRWVSLDDVVAAVLDGSVQNVGLAVSSLAAYASRAGGWKSLRPARSWDRPRSGGAI